MYDNLYNVRCSQTSYYFEKNETFSCLGDFMVGTVQCELHGEKNP